MRKPLSTLFMLCALGFLVVVILPTVQTSQGEAARGDVRPDLVSVAAQDAVAAGIPPDLFVKQIRQESNFNPDDYNPRSGAVGIAQFMPSTAAGLGIDPTNPYDALAGAARLMSRYTHNYGGDYAKALAAYNGGSGTLAEAMRNCGAAWLSCEPLETQAYVNKIMN